MQAYLDNAATTPLDQKVAEEMMAVMLECYGNPSSIHSHGRKARTLIEKARKTVATLLNTSPAEIFFTSGGTEADNTALVSSVHSYNIRHVISAKTEHHAVLHTLESLEKARKIEVSWVNILHNGHVDLNHLEAILQTKPRSLVSLMHGNNEVGNLLNLEEVSAMCQASNALFHSDTVQTMGHYQHDLQTIHADFLVGAAHKFHGPKGVGFLYINSQIKIAPFIHGGSQERNMRGGTENLYGIVGLSKALEIAYNGMKDHRKHIEQLKKHMIARLQENIAGITFNGDSANLESSLYTVLNISLPPAEANDMLLFNLDIHKISASGGSACSSGSEIGSHVLQALNVSPERGNIRFSFGKYTTLAEIDYTVAKLSEIVHNTLS